MHEWRPTLGATHDAGFTAFRVWAPEHRAVDLVLEGTGPQSREVLPLTRERCGHWSARLTVPPGTRYRYRLDGNDDATFPDPASRFQPDGVHGASQVVDPSSFAWTDAAWRPPALDRLVFYEIHIGTFTPQGTFRGAIERLSALRELGVTAIELMPVADFPGTRNWGYDGVSLFAPARCYGTPDDLRALVDAAHGEGLAVFLDVVYNHLGPDGAYANAFSPYYFTDAHQSPWGRGVNLDGPHSAEVRRFFIENALHWVHEYHIDGLRLDATHALQDESATHFLAELTTTVRQHAHRQVTFVAEDHRNLAHMLRPVSAGGWGIDAVWADDFHHHVRVHAARDREGYYQDFSGDVADLVKTLRQGWFFTGQHSAHLGERRGTDPAGLLPEQFVVCIQNHDQIGNRADGARLNHEVDLATYRALSALLAFAPQTPLLFMGQEWAASSPFMFFTDHAPDLGRKVTEGRRQEFSAFSAFADPAKRAAIPDPQSPETFEQSRLDWGEISRPPHAGVRRLYQRMLQLRPHGAGCDVRALGDAALIATRGDLSLVARLSGSGPVAIPHAGSTWRDVVLTTEDEDIAGEPVPVRVDTATPLTITFARPGAMLIRGLSFAP